MLSNKRFTIILSLVIAICIWGYVIGETNPVDTRTFRSVPIQLVNEESLQEKGLAVLETSDTEMNITIIGTRDCGNGQLGRCGKGRKRTEDRSSYSG